MKKIITIFIILFVGLSLQAQPPRDTIKKVVEISSDFTPLLIPTRKIMATPTIPSADSTKPNIIYKVPNQNLFFSYATIPMIPATYSPDKTIPFTQNGYISLGYGNFSMPFVEAAYNTKPASNNDWWWFAKIKGTSAKGALPFQKEANLKLDLGGVKSTIENEILFKIGLEKINSNLFGGNTLIIPVNKDTVQNNFLSSSFLISFKNNIYTNPRFYYEPSLKFSNINSNKFSELNVLLKVPFVFKQIQKVDIGLTGIADISSQKSLVSQSKNVFQINPYAAFTHKNIKIHIGIKPTAIKSANALLPDANISFGAKNKTVLVKIGYKGDYQKNNFDEFLNFTPYITKNYNWQISTFKELYGGLSFNFTNTLKLEVMAGLAKHKNLPLYFLDTISGRGFKVLYATTANNFKAKGNLQYTMSENLKINFDATLQAFTNVTGANRAWGLPWFMFNGDIHYLLTKHILLTGDIQLNNGGWNKLKNNREKLMPSSLFLNLGTEISIFKNAKIWMKANNLFAETNNRWLSYPTLGLNILGGFRYDF